MTTPKRNHGGKRPGAGRPSKVEDPVRLACDVPRAVADYYTKAAIAAGRKRAELLREVLERAAKAR